MRRDDIDLSVAVDVSRTCAVLVALRPAHAHLHRPALLDVNVEDFRRFVVRRQVLQLAVAIQVSRQHALGGDR